MWRRLPNTAAGAILHYHFPMRMFVLFLPALLFAQPPARFQTGYDSIRPPILKADLTFISSDALDGRMSLQRGSEVAIQWIAGEFAKAGLKPAAGDSYLQPVPLIEFATDRNLTSLNITYDNRHEVFHAPDARANFADEISVAAAVVFAGYGITAPELHYDDYAGIDAKGKIVLIFDHEPQENDPASIFNGTGNTRYATTRVKAMNAQQHGAVGVLIVAEPNRKHPSNQERVARIGGATTRKDPLPSQALADDALQIPAAIVSDAVAAELMAKAGSTPAELQKAIDADLKPQSRPLPDTSV